MPGGVGKLGGRLGRLPGAPSQGLADRPKRREWGGHIVIVLSRCVKASSYEGSVPRSVMFNSKVNMNISLTMNMYIGIGTNIDNKTMSTTINTGIDGKLSHYIESSNNHNHDNHSSKK